MVSTAKILAIAAGAILIVAWIFYVAGNAAPSWYALLIILLILVTLKKDFL